MESISISANKQRPLGIRPSGKGLSFEVVTSAKENMQDLVCLAGAAHEESRLSYIPFAPHKVEAIVNRALQDPTRNGILICRRNGAPVGAAYCTIGEYWIGTETLVTSVQNISVLDVERRRLLGGQVALGLVRGIESWSRSRNAKEIFFHVTSDVDLARTHKFVKRLGYQFIGGSYAKRIER